ncbi:signal peptidase I [Candidatus Pacearchaeota archaeon]|nr:signal peptidase I [Candidatus Pacearchaeota archaeon]
MIKKSDLKKFWDRFIFIVWKDDSPKGWLISVIFIFIVIKFIFFPTLSFVTGTSLPLAIVESCSMYHDGNLLSNFDNWWGNHESKYSEQIINKLDFQDFIFKNGFNKGDILFIVEAKPEKLEVGDVIIFQSNQRNPIIHRIIEIKKENNEYLFSTIGDNNNQQLIFEKNIEEEQLIGKAVFKIAPYIGWGKLIFYEYAKPKSERGLCQEN